MSLKSEGFYCVFSLLFNRKIIIEHLGCGRQSALRCEGSTMECGPKSERIRLLFSRHFDKQGHGCGGMVAWAEAAGRAALTREHGMFGQSNQQRLPGRSSTGIPRSWKLSEILVSRGGRGHRRCREQQAFAITRQQPVSFSRDGRR